MAVIYGGWDLLQWDSSSYAQAWADYEAGDRLVLSTDHHDLIIRVDHDGAVSVNWKRLHECATEVEPVDPDKRQGRAMCEAMEAAYAAGKTAR